MISRIILVHPPGVSRIDYQAINPGVASTSDLHQQLRISLYILFMLM